MSISQSYAASTGGEQGLSGLGTEIPYAVADGIAEIALQAGPLNLVTKNLLRGLNAALKPMSENEDIRCLILHGGSARVFCAGSDIPESTISVRMQVRTRSCLKTSCCAILRGCLFRPSPPSTVRHSEAALSWRWPVVTCLQVGCKSGIDRGIAGWTAGSGAMRLTGLVGPGRAKELLFTAATVTAEQALEWGMVNRVVADGSALEAARALARGIASRGPVSNRLAKELVDAAQDLPIDAALSLSTVAQEKILTAVTYMMACKHSLASEPRPSEGDSNGRRSGSRRGSKTRQGGAQV